MLATTETTRFSNEGNVRRDVDRGWMRRNGSEMIHPVRSVIAINHARGVNVTTFTTNERLSEEFYEEWSNTV